MDDIAKSAARLLRFGGKLCICQRPERVFDVMYAMRTNGIEPKNLRFVSKKGDSQPWLVLVEGKRGAKNGLKVLGNLVAYNDDGTLTGEMLSITEKYRK
jgi:tRNA1(Val) A37 N6-methylase TrmN6